MSETNTIVEKNKERFCELLRGTERLGVENVLSSLERLGFFTAPASAKHHLAQEGGLLQHSLNVYDQAAGIAAVQRRLNPAIAKELPKESIVIVSLLHDVCKADIYVQTEKFRKDAQNKLEKYLAYEADYSRCPLGHGEKSVIRLLKMGLGITSEEIIAIRWHMAGWDLAPSREANENFHIACAKTPLLSVLIAADELATRITEQENQDSK